MQNNPVIRLFNEIAPKYDFLNHVFSFNCDRKWRKILLRSLDMQPDAEVLDVCTGTANIALAMAEKHKSSKIYGIDLSAEMLKIGGIKVAQKKLDGRIALIKADALRLPFPDSTFDIISISFGIRNLVDRKRGIQEMKRVLKETGQIAILEFSPPQQSFLDKPYNLYLSRIIPFAGKIVSKSASAYQYLYTSIEDFIEPEELVNLLKDVGLREITSKRLTFGIVYLYIARNHNTHSTR